MWGWVVNLDLEWSFLQPGRVEIWPLVWPNEDLDNSPPPPKDNLGWGGGRFFLTKGLKYHVCKIEFCLYEKLRLHCKLLAGRVSLSSGDNSWYGTRLNWWYLTQSRLHNWSEYNLNTLARIYWKAGPVLLQFLVGSWVPTYAIGRLSRFLYKVTKSSSFIRVYSQIAMSLN